MITASSTNLQVDNADLGSEIGGRGSSRRNSVGGEGKGGKHRRRRKSDTMDRIDNDSVISSVSTHQMAVQQQFAEQQQKLQQQYQKDSGPETTSRRSSDQRPEPREPRVRRTSSRDSGGGGSSPSRRKLDVAAAATNGQAPISSPSGSLDENDGFTRPPPRTSPAHNTSYTSYNSPQVGVKTPTTNGRVARAKDGRDTGDSASRDPRPVSGSKKHSKGSGDQGDGTWWLKIF
jgi:hypothetical protein